jgi:serine/threonine-protein kinase RsbT
MGAAHRIVEGSIELRCLDARDRFACAARVLRFAEDAGFDARRAREIALCVSELASNAARHGGGGTLTVTMLTDPRAGLEITCVDGGPGIDDPKSALVDGWSRGRHLGPDDPRFEGLGAGLGAVLRLSDDIEIRAASGGGAVVRARKWL